MFNFFVDNRDGYFFEISIFIDDCDLLEYYEEQRHLVLPKPGVTYQRWKEAWMANVMPPPPPPDFGSSTVAPATDVRIVRFDVPAQPRQQGAMAPQVPSLQGLLSYLQKIIWLRTFPKMKTWKSILAFFKGFNCLETI